MTVRRPILQIPDIDARTAFVSIFDSTVTMNPPLPPRSGGEGVGGAGVPQQIRCQRSASNRCAINVCRTAPLTPTPPRHAQRRVEEGEINAAALSRSRQNAFFREVVFIYFPPSKQRAQGKPGARYCAR